MHQKIRLTIGLMSVAIMAACSPSQPPAEPDVAQPAEAMSAPPLAAEPPAPAPAVPAPSTDSGSMVVYTCDDGSGVTVTYDKYTALVKLPTGSTMLSRAEAASNSGNEAYLGEELSLYRNGNIVQLQVAGKFHACTKSPTNN